jgi:hypothetical protein
MTVECITPHLAVGDDIDASSLLQCDCFIYGTIFRTLEICFAELARFMAFASFF